MPVLKAHVDGQWVPLLAGRDGAQGPPGPASPHEGSNISVGVRQHGAVGDGTTVDTTAVDAALTAAGASGFVDFEAGTYRVTGSLGRKFWEARRSGPGVITDAAGNTFRVTPRNLGDVNTIYVHGTTGNDANDGLSPTRPLRTLNAVREIFEAGNGFDQGTWVVRLSGTITGGMRFQNLPFTKAFLRFEGDALTGGAPSTWVENNTADGERFGLRFEEAQNQRIHLARLGFRGFSTGGGAGWIMKSGGFIRTEDCATENCQIGSLYTGSVGFSEIRSVHQGYTTSGSRAQYNSSGSWTEVQWLGGPSATEGWHVSRQSVCHVDKCISQDHVRNGGWSDMSCRVSSAGSTYRRNSWNGIRGEGSVDIHIDDTTYGANVFGTGADANGMQNVSIRGTSRLAADEGIYAIPEHLTDTRFFSARTTALTADRGLRAYRVGAGARVSVRAYGDTAGTLAVTGGLDMGIVTVPAGGWVVDIVAQCTGGTAWTITRQVNGGAPTFASATSSGDIKPVFTPAGGAQLRGIEVRVGG